MSKINLRPSYNVYPEPIPVIEEEKFEFQPTLNLRRVAFEPINISNVTVSPLPGPVGLAYAMRINYGGSNEQS
jgi:hypothetical protein